MSAARPADILRRLESPATPDAELLRRFAAVRDEAAFAELLRRHGPLVFGVCRRVTGSGHDAEDAFQAVFLVLAQKAGRLRDPGRLANWLYGVAYRVALRARRAAARRRAREVVMPHPPDAPARPASPELPELGPVLDEELAALAACYRDAIVLCDLQGASREEAARALGVPEGTVSSRLANGRKKLAARLARRGVTLSAAALPIALADARAAAVPNELLARTCRLVLDCAAGGAVPGPLAHLLRGGATVRRTFVACVAGLAAVGGAVFAALPVAQPPVTEQPPPPKVAEKAPEPPKAKDEPKEAPGAFTAAPRLRGSVDVQLGDVSNVRWAPNGGALAVQGRTVNDGKPHQYAIVYPIAPDGEPGWALGAVLDDGDRLAALATDGSRFAAVLRENQLISGRHQLKVHELVTRKGQSRPQFVRHTVDLDAADSTEEAFAPDLKTFRAVVQGQNAAGAVNKLEVVEVDATTGKQTKMLFGIAPRPHALSPDGKRFAETSGDASRVFVYDLDRADGEALSAHQFEGKNDGPRPAPRSFETLMSFSPDGKRLAVSRGVSWTTILDADTGTALPELEGAKELHTLPGGYGFGANGRLFACTSRVYKLTTVKGKDGQEQVGISVPEGPGERPSYVLTVWDTQTGKALKTWKLPRSGVVAAFSPTRPLLAILEPNGEHSTRLGLWDFSAEVEKK